MQGRDFTRLLDHPEATFHEAAYSRFVSADAAITRRFTYTSCGNGKAEMLCDLEKEPRENTNVAGKPQYAEAPAKMRQLLKQREAEAAESKPQETPVVSLPVHPMKPSAPPAVPKAHATGRGSPITTIRRTRMPTFPSPASPHA